MTYWVVARTEIPLTHRHQVKCTGAMFDPTRQN
jgi:hypothetical protein